MSQLPFYWIDAFTDKKMGGNPCAVVMDADALDDAQMLAITREMNLSETAFVMKSQKADARARYFTPQGELPFAGHPTIATVHALLESGHFKSRNKITLELKAGIIPVEFERDTHHSKITMFQLTPKFMRTYDAAEIGAIYGLSPEDLLPGAPIQTVSTGSAVLLIPLKDFSALQRARIVDLERYLKLKSEGDFLFPHHFCLQGATSRGNTFARSLGMPPDGLEDPFTGSATGCMAAYLWKHGLIAQSKFIAEQGHWMQRPGEADVEVLGPRDAIQSIRVAGGAVTVIRGKIVT